MFTLFWSFLMSREEHSKGKNGVPETKGTEEGSAKRNITRKHDPDPSRYVGYLLRFMLVL